MQRITAYVSAMRWLAFRVACTQRKTSASKELDRLMSYQLQLWEEEGKHSSLPSEETHG